MLTYHTLISYYDKSCVHDIFNKMWEIVIFEKVGCSYLCALDTIRSIYSIHIM